MKNILIFGGTTEEHELADKLLKLPVDITLSVASDYGAAMVEEGEHLHVHAGRLDLVSMEALIQEKQFFCVVDATHPYAVEASSNIAAACDACHVPCLRLLRKPSSLEGCLVVDSVAGALAQLEQRSGAVLLTTGVKDLAEFAQLEDFAARLYPRVLPSEESIARCIELGYDRSHIIAMQGPFSYELNVALMHQFGIESMVTKDSGSAGGVGEKIDAAHACGALAIVILRPDERLEGLSCDEVVDKVTQLLGGDAA